MKQFLYSFRSSARKSIGLALKIEIVETKGDNTGDFMISTGTGLVSGEVSWNISEVILILERNILSNRVRCGVCFDSSQQEKIACVSY